VPLYMTFNPRPGLFKLQFNYLRRQQAWEQPGDLSIQRVGDVGARHADADLTLIASDSSTEIGLTLVARDGQFRIETLQRFLRNIARVTGTLAGAADRAIS